MGKSTPAPPDPVATAQAQGQANIDATRDSARLNRYSTVGPGYRSTWINNGDDGVPTTQVTELDPAAQAVFNQGIANAGTAGQRAAGILNNDFDDSGGITGLPQLFSANFLQGGSGNGGATPGGGSGSSALDQAQDAVYSRYARTLDPEQALQREQNTVSLDSRGIPVGSEAWVKAQNQLDLSQNSARQDARDASVSAGNALQGQLFGQSLAARQDAQQSVMQRLAALIGIGQGGIPQASGPQTAQMQVAPVDVAGINQGSYNAQAANAASENQAKTQAAGAATAVALSALSAY